MLFITGQGIGRLMDVTVVADFVSGIDNSVHCFRVLLYTPGRYKKGFRQFKTLEGIKYPGNTHFRSVFQC